ncbi:MAG: GAF domain-containing protein [Anaerolineae bacterium]|nr:GAF domain-containing protein [Anaerolineae bacterium]
MSARRGNSLRMPNWRLVLLSVLVLAVCFFYTYAAVYLAPYPGLTWGLDWVVTAVEPCETNLAWCEANRGSLQVGDQMLVVGGLTHGEFLRDKTSVTFSGYGPGETVSITFLRGDEELTAGWQMLGPTNASRFRRLMDSLPLCIPFWAAGTLILVLLRPRDLRWRLLILFNYVAAIWLAAGAHSTRGVACASPVQHVFAWLWAPIYLHLHLVVPSPLFQRYRRYFLLPAYAITAVLAALEIFQVLPNVASYLGLVLAFSLSFGLLVFRLLRRDSADELAVRLILIGMGLAFGPAIVLWIVPLLLGTSLPGELTLYILSFAIPSLPFFYIYAIYKRRLGTLEFRANRLLSSYSFFLLYATAFALVFSIGGQWLNAGSVVFGLVISTLFVILALPLRARFQRLIDRLAYGARHDPDEIVRVFANRITTALDHGALAQLLADEVMPSLLIRQSALVLIEDGRFAPVYVEGVELEEAPEMAQKIRELLDRAGRYRPPGTEAADELAWVRLAIPLQVRGKMVGAWLFGRRDPDDYYPQGDVVLLHTLADQVAVAVENGRLFQAERGQRELAEALAAAAAGIDSTLQLDMVLDRILGQVERVVAGDAFNIMLVEEAGIARVVHGRGYERLGAEDVISNSTVTIVDYPILVKMTQEGKPQVVRDTTADPGWIPRRGQRWLRSYVGAPIRVGGWTVGFLSVDGTRPGQFEPADASRLQAFANHAAIAIENARLYTEQRRRAEEADLLLGIANTINSTLELDYILKEVAIRAARACQANRCTILLLDEDGEMLQPIMSQFASGEADLELWQLFKEARYPRRVADLPEAARVIQERRPLYIPDVRSVSILPQWTEPFGVGCLLVVPLTSRERTVGLMALDHPDPRYVFTNEQVNLAMTVGGQAAVAIENARLHRELQDYAHQLEQRVQERTSELEAQYAWLATILRSSSDGIIVADAEGGIIQANPVVEAWLAQVLSLEDAGRLQEAVRSLAVRVEERSEEVLELTGLDLHLSASPILEQGTKKAAVVIAAHDISHLKALDRMKSRFISDVSHELRTPITTIKLYAALMRRSSPQKMREYLDMLTQEADRQAKLVEDILQISRIEAARLEMEAHPTNLNELAAEIVASRQTAAQERGLTLKCQVVEPGPQALVDPNRIMQVLNSLVTNAIDYTTAGGEVLVSVKEEATDSRAWAVLTVADTGIGISEEELPHIFDRFFRGEHPRLMGVPGTGLGLAISRDIVELHGGKITVESAVGAGSTFAVWLPVAQAEDGASASP